MEPTKVSWGLGITLNIGDYQSLRLDMSVEDHVRDNESVVQASQRIYDLVDSELEKRIEEARSELGK